MNFLFIITVYIALIYMAPLNNAEPRLTPLTGLLSRTTDYIPQITHTSDQAIATAISAHQTPATHTLLIFLNAIETKTFKDEPITYELLIALSQKAAPLITTTSLIYNIFGAPRRQTEFQETILPSALKEATENSPTPLNLLFSKALSFSQSFSLTSFVREQTVNQFSPDDWMIVTIASSRDSEKSPLPSFFLLVPKSYIKKHCPAYSGNTLTRKELQSIGLKLGSSNHSAYKNKEEWLEYCKTLYSTQEGYFLKAFEKLVLPISSYAPAEKSLYPQWAIYLTGHGLAGKSIASLSLTDFQKLLVKLDQK